MVSRDGRKVKGQELQYAIGPSFTKRLSLMKKIALAAFLLAASFARAQQGAPFRPPAVPLVAHDPYFSIWSMADRLTDSPTSHWTGKPNSLAAMARVDGKSFRLMGRDRQASPALDQTRV